MGCLSAMMPAIRDSSSCLADSTASFWDMDSWTASYTCAKHHSALSQDTLTDPMASLSCYRTESSM